MMFNEKNSKDMRIQIVFLMFLLTIVSCQEDEFETYTGGNYLSFYSNPATDSIVETFFFHQGMEEIEVPVKFNLGGNLLKEDRPISLSIVDSLSGLLEDGRVVRPLEEDDFAFPETMMFHKGVNVDSIFVKLRKSPKLDDAYCRVVLRVEANDYFAVGETAYSYTKIYFTSMISQPVWWDETVVDYYLGAFTPKKYEVFCREVGVTDLTGVEEKYIREYALEFKRYLEAHEEYEEDGTRMTVTVIG